MAKTTSNKKSNKFISTNPTAKMLETISWVALGISLSLFKALPPLALYVILPTWLLIGTAIHIWRDRIVKKEREEKGFDRKGRPLVRPVPPDPPY